MEACLWKPLGGKNAAHKSKFGVSISKFQLNNSKFLIVLFI